MQDHVTSASLIAAAKDAGNWLKQENFKSSSTATRLNRYFMDAFKSDNPLARQAEYILRRYPVSSACNKLLLRIAQNGLYNERSEGKKPVEYNASHENGTPPAVRAEEMLKLLRYKDIKREKISPSIANFVEEYRAELEAAFVNLYADECQRSLQLLSRIELEEKARLILERHLSIGSKQMALA